MWHSVLLIAYMKNYMGNFYTFSEVAASPWLHPQSFIPIYDKGKSGASVHSHCVSSEHAAMYHKDDAFHFYLAWLMNNPRSRLWLQNAKMLWLKVYIKLVDEYK